MGFAKSGVGLPPIRMTEASEPFPKPSRKEVEKVRACANPLFAFMEKLSSKSRTVDEGTSPDKARTDSPLLGLGMIPVSAPRM